MKPFTYLLFFLFPILSFASTYQVGSDKEFTSPNQLYNAGILLDGDTVEIDAEEYIGQNCLANWQANNLLIKGVGGKPHLIADGQYILGKGIWVLSGNDIIVENIEFSEAVVPDNNGAGIRLDGIGMTVRSCFFHHNENGILTSNPYEGDILIEYTEFAYNGYGDGFSYNLYIGHVSKLTFQFNYSHHAIVGHNLKSRAEENIILYNRIMDEETGNSSRLIDLPNGGFSIVMGNLLMQGDNAPNNNMVGYGLEGLSNDINEFHVINNTFVNKKTSSSLFISMQFGTEVSSIRNNIFAGDGYLIDAQSLFISNNQYVFDVANLYFLTEAEYDYQLTNLSSVMNWGVDVEPAGGYSLTPTFSYLHPTSQMDRPDDGAIDVGAYEYVPAAGISELDADQFLVYPNPSSGIFNFTQEIEKGSTFCIKNLSGKTIFCDKLKNYIDLTFLENGNYLFEVLEEGQTLTLRQISIMH